MCLNVRNFLSYERRVRRSLGLTLATSLTTCAMSSHANT
eukprot:UN10581